MTGAEAFCLTIVATLLWVTVRGQDAWPLSAYPMFSGRLRLDEVEVFRVALESPDGTVDWWRPRHYRYAEKLGRQWLRLHHALPADAAARAARAMAQHQLLCEVARLVRHEQGEATGWRALHMVQRTVRRTESGALTIHHETVLVKPWLELAPQPA